MATIEMDVRRQQAVGCRSVSTSIVREDEFQVRNEHFLLSLREKFTSFRCRWMRPATRADFFSGEKEMETRKRKSEFPFMHIQIDQF